MIDQNSQFFAILTRIGEAKQANADALGIPWTFSAMGVGDANGTDPVPDRAQTRLINERRRAPVNMVRIDPSDPSIIITEQVIPPDAGGWWIREIGLYDADGDLVAIANCAPSYKPLLAQGTGKTQVVRMNFIVRSTGNITLKIDPSVVLATREYVDSKLIEALPAGRPAGTYTKVTINERGFVVAGANPTTLAGYGILDAYTAAQVDAALAFKANLQSPYFTGTPRADTAPLGTSTKQLASCEFVVGSINALIGATPGALDTLVELAAALGNDPNYAATITNQLATKADKAATLAGYGVAFASRPETVAGVVEDKPVSPSGLAAAIAAIDPWALQPIGVPIPVTFGAAEPPKDKPGYRYIKLSAGDAYNAGVLSDEVVSGVAPLLTANAKISLPGSPIIGTTVHLLNTERRYLRPGLAGTIQNDALQNITGSITGIIPSATALAAGGAINFTQSTYSAGTNIQGLGMDNFIFDASRVARTDNETRTKNIGANYYMRIK
ncbi:phage tail protein [Pseudomonas donghuensis]|uniref:phage tail protein n=1 Tax=Pseudomonas donghuensis TaxID=1163398 RepID=UPI00215DF1A5|nr:phage tail protein [Pseudomonas donghuensis]UVL30685.1 phage tail protein [Pseudomonas donghuensis]WSE84596.1 phage tail protein [Pseudomonas donghuensis]